MTSPHDDTCVDLEGARLRVDPSITRDELAMLADVITAAKRHARANARCGNVHTEEHCCGIHDHHVTPHRGCILR